MVRVESDARIRIGRVLDSGAAGVMFPRLDDAEQVRAAIKHLYYPPRGDRGVATYNRACRFGLDPGALDRANDQVLGIVQIESAQAVAAAEEIASIDGVDVLFVGPRDLTQDLGVPGQTTAQVFLDALGAGSRRRPQAREVVRSAGQRRRCGGGQVRRGLEFRHRRLGLHTARHRRDHPARPGDEGLTTPFDLSRLDRSKAMTPPCGGEENQ